ncbi:hypothetical protein BC835DRAFT_1307688 [Cytidiella melzeri]|nr:hypothetical protein BC835DRAFT_1307688 [Cytidiella melzeri]
MRSAPVPKVLRRARPCSVISTVKCTLTQDEGMRNKHTQPNKTERKRAERWDGEEEQRDEIERTLTAIVASSGAYSLCFALLHGSAFTGSLASWLPGSLASMLYLTTLQGLLSRIAYLLRSLVPTCCVQTPYKDCFRLAYSAYPASVVFSYLPFAQSSALEIRRQRVVSIVARRLESAVVGGNVEGTSRLEFDNLEQILSYKGLCLARTIAGCGFWPDCESGDEPLRKRLTTIRTLGGLVWDFKRNTSAADCSDSRGVYVDYLAMVTEVGMPSGCGKWVLSFVCAAYSSGVNMISASFATDGLEQGVHHSPRDLADSIGIHYSVLVPNITVVMLSRPNVTSDIEVVAVPTGVSSVIWFASVSTAQAYHGEHGIDMFLLAVVDRCTCSLLSTASTARTMGLNIYYSEDRTGTLGGNTATASTMGGNTARITASTAKTMGGNIYHSEDRTGTQRGKAEEAATGMFASRDEGNVVEWLWEYMGFILFYQNRKDGSGYSETGNPHGMTKGRRGEQTDTSKIKWKAENTTQKLLPNVFAITFPHFGGQ